MAAPTENGDAGVLVSEEAEQKQLLRAMANKMYEEERARRIKEEQEVDDDLVKKRALESLVRVQEDIVRAVNVMKVKADSEMEQAQRVTTEKKNVVHDELVRKSAAKEVDRQAEEERERRISDEKGEYNHERQTTYGKLVTVQEDLLKTLRTMKADQEMKLEQERWVLVGKKHQMQEELVYSVGTKTADSAMDKEQDRRKKENLTEEECQRITAIAFKMIDVQKELLATKKPAQAIGGTVSQEVLEEAKAYVQEQIRRKAAQREAIGLMDEEQKRRVADGSDRKVSDAQAGVMEAINRKAGVKKAKDLVAATQQEYVQAEIKARVQEDTMRKVNQKNVDKAMDEEKSDRILESSGRDLPQISVDVKKEILDHTKK